MSNDLDQIEDVLIREERESRQEKMVVSGRSVFEIQRLQKRSSRDRGLQGENKT